MQNGWCVLRVLMHSRTQFDLFGCQFLTISEHNYSALRLLRLSSDRLLHRTEPGFVQVLSAVTCSVFIPDHFFWALATGSTISTDFVTNLISTFQAYFRLKRPSISFEDGYGPKARLTGHNLFTVTSRIVHLHLARRHSSVSQTERNNRLQQDGAGM
ncbi:uncharacterized protein M421DRAFT_251934 [Didymella exigua CBS 183.55]|uniref:Uncharacterized protein n=1 Tax=Didymella exigua CBS 183.55 TaxID=1150837 RepID=A0A6A5RZ59_9PLEO|nr:uncharacterized protein M421DRAFT_251934 [Didymella exigua CBS 183.55]KAF1932893.1 hypothetical protein M421DRAFT_251934 [Didymella exigua CBS 183.55]